MKKVLYVITSPAHKRVFESLVERQDLEQMVVGQAPSELRMVPEDYSGFKIKNIRYVNKNDYVNEIKACVNDFKPDLYVQADLSDIHRKVWESSVKAGRLYKRIYVSHGMGGNNLKEIMKSVEFDLSGWHGLDLYCGPDLRFADWVKHVAKVDNSKILLNTFPQLDILHDSNYYNSYRESVIKKTKCPSAKKVILFLGFCCKDRYDFKHHNEDYFSTAIELGLIAKQHNWLVMIKPRQTHEDMMDFLRTHKWGSKYIESYKALHRNNNVHFIGPASTHIYRYYFADAFVINGCSTVEIEVCAIQKPLFAVRTDLKCLQSGYDPFDTTKTHAAMSIPDLAELEHDLLGCFNEGKFHRPEKQKYLLDSIGLSFDGKHHERLQNKLSEL